DYRLVGRDHHAGVPLHELAHTGDLTGVDADLGAVVVGAGVEGHDALLQRGGARSLPYAVDRRLDLGRAVLDGRQAVRHRHAEVVVAVRADAHVLRLRHVLEDRADEAPVLVRGAVARRVRDVDGVGAGGYRRAHELV